MGSRSSHSHPHPKLKPPSRALFSCGMFRNCSQTVLSPTTTTPLTPPPSSGLLPPASPRPPPPAALPSQSEPEHPQGPAPAATAAEPEAPQPSSSSSSSSSTSQSFTQWRFPLTHPLLETGHHPTLEPAFVAPSDDLAGAFRAAEIHLASGYVIPALRLLERSLVRDAGAAAVPCPPSVMAGVVASVLDLATARPAAKVLLALLLAEGNRRLAVEAGASSAVVEAVTTASTSSAKGTTTAERALAALELICTVPEGAAEVRRNSATSRALVGAVEKLARRGRECAIGVLSAIYAGEWAAAAAPEVGRTVVMALQGECSARGRRKGAQLLKALKENGRLDLPEDAC